MQDGPGHLDGDRPPVGTARRLLGRGFDLVLRVAPIAALVAIGAYIAAQQAISPQRRAVKLAVALGLLALMFRFEVVSSLYLFTLLFPFPSGISIGSTNLVLMTVIPMVWAVRATSNRVPIFHSTPVDRAIGLLMLAYVLSFFNVDDPRLVVKGVQVVWLQLACLAYFYLIVRFVDDERKLDRLLMTACIAVGFVMFTAITEMFFPGKVIIPGWIGLPRIPGQGRLGARIVGLRIGGAVGSHSLLSDMGTMFLGVMIYLAVRSRNAIPALFWWLVSLMTFVAMLGSANRGAFVAGVVGLAEAVRLFRRQLGGARLALIIVGVSVVFFVSESLVEKHTYAASLTERLLHTRFEGVVPENRTMTWAPALKGSLDHFFIGHGPYYDTGKGLEFRYWPHNAYIFYLYTIGFVGLAAFLWVVYTVWRQGDAHALPGVDGTPLGDVIKLLRVALVIFLVAQLRTDHQRDDIYPFVAWLVFGTTVAAGRIARARAGGPGGATEARPPRAGAVELRSGGRLRGGAPGTPARGSD